MRRRSSRGSLQDLRKIQEPERQEEIIVHAWGQPVVITERQRPEEEPEEKPEEAEEEPVSSVQDMPTEVLLARVRGLLAGWRHGDAAWELEVIQTFEKRMGFEEIDTAVEPALKPGSRLRSLVEPEGVEPGHGPPPSETLPHRRPKKEDTGLARHMNHAVPAFLGTIGTVIARRLLPGRPLLTAIPAVLGVLSSLARHGAAQK